LAGDTMKKQKQLKKRPKTRNAPKVDRTRRSSPGDKDNELARLKRERDEALEQQKVTFEVLQVVSVSPGELEPVFKTILETATRICEAAFGNLQRITDAGDRSLILILSDINMPGMSGLELLPKAKAMRPDVPIIMITAYGDVETKRNALENGAEALLTRPIDFGSLRSEIDTRVERAA
jgi:CheY-like chemotaxis protein